MAALQTAFDFNVLGGESRDSRGAARMQARELPQEPRTEPRMAHAPQLAPSPPPAPVPQAVLVTRRPDAVATDGSSHASPGKQALEDTLRAAVATPLRVTITDNRRTMISMRKRPGFTELRLHHMFLTADAVTVQALADYVGRSDRSASLELGRYIDSHRTRIRKRVTRAVTLSTAGLHHDLLAIYAEINARHFEGKADVRITWGREPTGSRSRSRRRRSIKLGSYCSREQLVRVHPTLDAEYVPRFFVEYIMYHELLHHVLPPVIRGGRRQLHDRRFKTLERAFPDYEKALRWERANLDRLLAF